MSKYAKLEGTSIINIIECEDSVIGTIEGHYIKETELTGIAHVGGTYNLEKNKFISPNYFEGWVLNEETLEWQSPVPKPSENAIWSGVSNSWIVIEDIDTEYNPDGALS